MKPINKYILVNKIDEEVKTQSGLLLSAEDTDRTCKTNTCECGERL